MLKWPVRSFVVMLTCSVGAGRPAFGQRPAPPADPRPPVASQKAGADDLETLTSQVRLLLREGKFAEATGPAGEAAAVALATYGPDHWRTFDANRRLDVARTAKDQPEPVRRELVAALQNDARSRELSKTEPLTAFDLAERAVTEYGKALGVDAPEVGRAWHLVGWLRAYWHDSEGVNPKRARDAFLKALDIRRKTLPPNHPDLGDTLHNLGVARSALGDLDEAVKDFAAAADVWRSKHVANALRLAESQTNRGVLLRKLGDPAGARASFDEAMSARRRSLAASDPLLAESLAHLAAAEKDTGDLAAAGKNLKEAVAIRRRVAQPDALLLGDLLTELGLIRQDLKDYPSARASLEDALMFRRMVRPSAPVGVAMSLSNLGAVLQKQVDNLGAKSRFEEALAFFRTHLPEGHLDLAPVLYNLGLVQNELLDYQGALKSLAEALTIRKKGLRPEDPLIAEVLNDLGLTQQDLRDYAAARTSLQDAVAIRRKALKPDDPVLAESLANLGTLQEELRDYEGALSSYTGARDVYRKAPVPNDFGVAALLVNLGHLEMVIGDARARTHLRAALEIYRAQVPQNRPLIALCLSNLGSAELNFGEARDARKYHDEALSIRRDVLPACHPDLARSLALLGADEVLVGDYPAARDHLAVALALLRASLPSDHPEIAEVLQGSLLVGLVAGEPAPDTAARFDDVLAVMRAHLLGVAGLQAEAEQFREAASARWTVSLYLSWVLGRGSTLSAAEAYDRAAGLKGLVTARQSWARELRDTADPATLPLLNELRDVNLRLLRAAYAPQRPSPRHPDRPHDPSFELARLAEARRGLERRIVAEVKAYRRYEEKAALGGAAVRGALPAGCILIDVFAYTHMEAPLPGSREPLVERRLVAFIIHGGGGATTAVPLGRVDHVADAVTRWRTQVINGTPEEPQRRESGAELRDLWLKLEPHVQGAGVVLLAPDGPLNYLPFAGLPGAREGEFLVHDYTFATLPVPLLLPEILSRKADPAAKPSLLLVGDVNFGEPREKRDGGPPKDLDLPVFRPLPGTADEVKDLRARFRAAFPGADAPIDLRGDQAIRAAVVAAMPGNRFAHLATHGFFAREVPEPTRADARGLKSTLPPGAAPGSIPAVQSGLVFAGVNRADRPASDTLLTALEVEDLPLRGAELVTLSACETGQGELNVTDGVLGLQRAFQVAGARSVAASQWKVPDLATRSLMDAFYRRLWAPSPVGKAEALKQAQLHMIAQWRKQPGEFTDWSHRGGVKPKPDGRPLPPFFWAAFTVSGDWR
jgi:CHAT domain-containing protein/tetratricopeptide (TPR) repeat protein